MGCLGLLSARVIVPRARILSIFVFEWPTTLRGENWRLEHIFVSALDKALSRELKKNRSNCLFKIVAEWSLNIYEWLQRRPYLAEQYGAVWYWWLAVEVFGFLSSSFCTNTFDPFPINFYVPPLLWLRSSSAKKKTTIISLHFRTNAASAWWGQ